MMGIGLEMSIGRGRKLSPLILGVLEDEKTKTDFVSTVVPFAGGTLGTAAGLI
jgi:hypothetical protein